MPLDGDAGTLAVLNLHDHHAAIIRSSGDAIVAKDLEGRVLLWNPAAEELFGWSAEEMTGQSIRRLLPDDRQDEEDEILSKVRAGEKIGLFITERLHKLGHRVHVAVTISPVRDASGQIVGASKVARDATDRAKIERRLRRSEERFRLLADNIVQLAWMAAPNGTVEWFNNRWYEYTGIDPENPDEEARENILPAEMRDDVRARFRAAIASGEEWEDVIPLRGADGTFRWFLSHAKPIRDDNGRIRCWFGTNTDITQQREQAEQITILLREVNHRSKNMLAKVQALARSSIRDNPALVKRFEERVGSLSVNQDILVRRDWKEVPAGELVDSQLDFLGDAKDRIVCTGPDCALIPRAAEIVGMALHELATNSLKYGALSVAGGSVAIDWECDRDRFAIAWREAGGPTVEKPASRGFGSQLIEDIPRRSLGAEVVHEFPPDGIVWQLVGGGDLIADPVRERA